MQINLTFRHFEPTDALKTFAREKVEHIQKFLDHASEASIVLSLEKHLHQAEVLIHSGQFYLRGKEKTDDMYASIGAAVDKIERQAKRYKGRLRTHKNPGHHNENAARVREHTLEIDSHDGAAEEAPPAAPARTIDSREVVAKKMSVDEAILQLDLADEPFLVFTNAATNHVAVLTRRQDAKSGTQTYSLVDARPSA